jgi:hypothetical protein
MPPKRIFVRGCGDRFGQEIALLARDRSLGLDRQAENRPELFQIERRKTFRDRGNTPCDGVPRDQRGEVLSSRLRRPEIELFISIKSLMGWK